MPDWIAQIARLLLDCWIAHAKKAGAPEKKEAHLQEAAGKWKSGWCEKEGWETNKSATPSATEALAAGDGDPQTVLLDLVALLLGETLRLLGRRLATRYPR